MKSLVVVVAVLSLSLPARAQAPGTFADTGRMSVGRAFHTATLLPDGKVLIVGGGSADIYDPAIASFTPAGKLNIARSSPVTTLLNDGRVLIAAGDENVNGVPPLHATAEIYDPTSGTFTRTADLLGQHVASTATLLRNGKVLIAGGYTEVCCPTPAARAELFDPESGLFSLAGPYAGPGDGYISDDPSLLNATLLHDGRVLLAGEPQSEIFDPDTNSFELTGKMTTPCFLSYFPNYIYGRTSTLLPDGRVLLTGGEHEDCGRFAYAELFDPATGLFSPTGTMHWPRDNHQATLLRDGTVLITGGEVDTCNRNGCVFSGTVASAEVYNPRTGMFTYTGDMTESLAGHTSTMLGNGEVLITGGYFYLGIGSGSCCSVEAQLYTPAISPPFGRRKIAH